MKNLKSKLPIFLGVLLIAFGLFLFWQRDGNAFRDAQPAAPVVASKPWVAPAPTTIQGNPVHIDIPSLNISLAIINGTYNTKTKTWTLTDDKVQYAVMTPPPNNASGNTFLYGHYRKSVFANLHNIKPGAQAIITTSNGHIFTYTLSRITTTDPSNVSLFSYTGKPILTIQTCSGLFFQNRQLFTFDLTEVK